MANKGGVITRKEMIEDEALNWGAEHRKELQKTIDKYKELTIVTLQMSKTVKSIKGAPNNSTYIKEKQQENELSKEAIAISKELATQEKTLASLREKNKLATSETAVAIAKERIEIQNKNKEVKQGIQEETSAYAKLNNARTAAKKNLLDLVATQGTGTESVKKAQKEFDVLDKKVKQADHAAQDFTKSVGNYSAGFIDAIEKTGLFGGKIGEITRQTIGFVQSAGGVAEKINEVSDSLVTGVRNMIGFGVSTQTSTLATTEQAVASEIATVSQIGFATATQVATVAEQEQAVATTSLGAKQLILDGINKILTVSSTIMWAAMTGGISLLIVGVAAIITYFSSMQEGIDKVMSVFTPLSTLFSAFLGVVQNVGKSLVDAFSNPKKSLNELYEFVKNNLINRFTAFGVILEGIINLDFKKITNGALQAATGVENVTGKIANAGKVAGKFLSDNIAKGKEIHRLNLLIEKSQLALNKAEIETGNIKEANLLISKDTSRSFAERANAVEKIIAAEQKQGDAEAAIIENKIKKLKIEQSLRDTGRAGQQEIIDLEVALDNAQDRGEDARRENMKVLSGLKKEQNAISEANHKAQLERDRLEFESKYNLQKSELEREISKNDEIAKDQTKTLAERIQAEYNSQQAQEDLLLKTKAFELSKEGLTANDKIRINEEYAFNVVEINKKTEKEISEIKEQETKKLEAEFKKQLEDLSKFNDDQKKIEEDKILEQKRNLAKGEINQEEYEKRILEIKKEASDKAIDDQLNALEKQLSVLAVTEEQKQLLADKFRELRNQKENADLDAQIKANQDTAKKREEIIGSSSKMIADALGLDAANLTSFIDGIMNGFGEGFEGAAKAAQEGLQIVSEIGEQVFQKNIENIDGQIKANDDYYAKQIELAGNDQRQKDLLQKERDKKNTELEKKKRAEQHKQAVFEKAVTIAQIAIQTALSVVKASPAIPLMVMAGVAGAIALATAIATPIPKYKHGRRGGPAEFAEVGDGFVHEIIEKKDGRAFMTPNKPTFTYLEQGDKVHSSVEDYYRLQRMALLSDIDAQGRSLSNFQAIQIENTYGKETLSVMKETLSVLKKQKNGTVINLPKMDFNHEIWKMKNKSWS